MPRRPAQAAQDRLHLLAGEDERQADRTLRARDVLEAGELAPRTSRYRKRRALKAWFWVDALTCASDARCAR